MADREVHVEMVLEDNFTLSLSDLCRACDVHADWLIELIDEGILDPQGGEPVRWRFSGLSLRRVHIIRRLQRDLGVNLAGAALALELMNERDALYEQLALLRERGHTGKPDS